MWMEKEHFKDLMLTDQKAFAGYARLFMELKGCTVTGLFGLVLGEISGGGTTKPYFHRLW